MEELVKILKMPEQELKKYLYNKLLNNNMFPICSDGFVYGRGDIPVLLVAHMDTVFDNAPENIIINEETQELTAPETGLGGDDRCGIYAILKILEEYRPYVLFTEGEEIGGIGARKALKTLVKPPVKYIIELDRHGNNDCVFYECGNIEFIKYIESFKFNTENGIFSDISILGPSWDIAAVNLSSGYYYEHTYEEKIKFNELLSIIERVKKILKYQSKAKYFDYQEIKYSLDDNLINYQNLFTKEYDLLWEIFNYPVKPKTRTLK